MNFLDEVWTGNCYYIQKQIGLPEVTWKTIIKMKRRQVPFSQ
jgi:hypothetical protein